jgi:hypothetical protein
VCLGRRLEWSWPSLSWGSGRRRGQPCLKVRAWRIRKLTIRFAHRSAWGKNDATPYGWRRPAARSQWTRLFTSCLSEHS